MKRGDEILWRGTHFVALFVATLRRLHLVELLRRLVLAALNLFGWLGLWMIDRVEAYSLSLVLQPSNHPTIQPRRREKLNIRLAFQPVTEDTIGQR